MDGTYSRPLGWPGTAWEGDTEIGVKERVRECRFDSTGSKTGAIGWLL